MSAEWGMQPMPASLWWWGRIAGVVLVAGVGYLGFEDRGILGDGARIGRLILAASVLSARHAGSPPQGKAVYVYRAYIYG